MLEPRLCFLIPGSCSGMVVIAAPASAAMGCLPHLLAPLYVSGYPTILRSLRFVSTLNREEPPSHLPSRRSFLYAASDYHPSQGGGANHSATSFESSSALSPVPTHRGRSRDGSGSRPCPTPSWNSTGGRRIVSNIRIPDALRRCPPSSRCGASHAPGMPMRNGIWRPPPATALRTRSWTSSVRHHNPSVSNDMQSRCDAGPVSGCCTRRPKE